MKLCPKCGEKIISNSEKACAVCGGAAENGNTGVALKIKNERISRHGKTGFAVYDAEGNKAGILYRRKDDGEYVFFSKSESALPKDKNLRIVKSDSGFSWTQTIAHGNYDAEALFFEEQRGVFGDNRKIYVTNEDGAICDYGDVQKILEEKGENTFFFHGIEANERNARAAEKRSTYRKIEVGVFWTCVCRDGVELVYDKGKLVRAGKKFISEKVVKDEDGINFKPSHKKAWESAASASCGGKYAGFSFSDFPRGRIWYDKEESRHYVMYDSALSPVEKKLKKELGQVFDLVDPEYFGDAFYKAKKEETAELVKRFWQE